MQHRANKRELLSASIDDYRESRRTDVKAQAVDSGKGERKSNFITGARQKRSAEFCQPY